MATSTIFNFNFNNSEIVDSTGQWYDASTGTPTIEFIEHDGNTALLQRAYVAGTAYTRDINPVFFQSRDPTFTAHTYTIELQLYPLRDPGGANFGPESGPVLAFNPDTADEENWVGLNSGQHGSYSNTFYWCEYGLGPNGDGIPFLTVTAADGTYNRWYSIRIERVDDGTNTGATVKVYVDGTLVGNETLTYPQDARRGRIGDSIRYTYRRSSIDPQGAGAAIDNFKLTAGIAPSSVVDVSLANLQRNNANLLSFIKGKVPTVNDGTLTIKVNGATAGTFTANQSTNATANITVPTAVSELANDSGYLTSSSNLDASKLTSGTVDIARLPQGALERLVKVANEAARYALTTADVQLGDTVQQLDTGIMYVVTDIDHLDSAAGYTEYTAGTAASVPWSGVTGKPTFAAVATSGAYSDLTGTPTIPTVNDATLTIQQNSVTVDTFTANSSTDKTVNISVPTKTSDLNNDSGFITGVAWDDVSNKPSFATVATSGSYNDLSNKPTIPTVNDATLTIQKNGTTIDTFTANSSSDKTVNITVPTNTNELTNGAGFITADYAVPRSGGAVMTGTSLGRTDNISSITFCGGTDANNGGCIKICGKDNVDNGDVFITAKDEAQSNGIHLRPNGDTQLINCAVLYPTSDNFARLGYPAYRWTEVCAATGTINTSDSRLKNSIKDIDDALLDAWGNVEPKQYKFNDATEKKGDKARYHTGYLAQDIQAECEKQGVNASDYGLFCYDEWDEQEEVSEEVETEKDGKIIKEKRIIQPRREKGNAYALRYEEALVVECKYLRRCVERLTARIEQLEKGKE